jgi:hypothetical protein
MTGTEQTPFRVPPDEYGDAWRADYLALYNEYVASADRISDRRYTANSFFLSINTVLLGATGYLTGDGENLVWLAAFAGILFSYTWKRLIASYKSLNSAKFAVIIEMEQQLPVAPYEAEWQHLKKGMDTSAHVPFSTLESWVPMVFMLLHAVVVVVNLQAWLFGAGAHGV